MSPKGSSDLLSIIELSSLSVAQKFKFKSFLRLLADSSKNTGSTESILNDASAFISEVQDPSRIPLEFLSYFLANYPLQASVFSFFQCYFQAWRCLPESLKSRPQIDKSGLLERTSAQLKGSYGNLAAFLSPGISRPALIDGGSGRALSHKDLAGFIERFSLPIDSAEQTQVVVLALPNGPLLGLALIATTAYYAAAPINTSGGKGQFRCDVELTGSRCILAVEDDVDKLGLREEWVSDAGISVFLLQQGPGLTFSVETLDSRHHSQHGARRLNAPDDVALMLFTSGTSGKKKLVPMTLHTIISGVSCVVTSWSLTWQDVCLNVMPLNHVGGIIRNLFAPVFSRGCSILCPAFDPNLFWDLVGEGGPTWYYASPSIHMSILAERENRTREVSEQNLRLICNAGGGLLPSLAADLADTFRCSVLPSYGMTECMPICTPPLGYTLDRRGTSGKSCGPEISIFSDNREPLPAFHTGHINVRGGPTFSGYLGPNSHIDTTCFDLNRYFDTGDLGYLDEEGYLYITGRSKEVINRGGELISPLEVEEAIIAAAQIPDSSIYQRVVEVLAFSAPHDILQEVVAMAIVVPAGKKRPDLRDIQTAVKTSLHPSKWPVALVYMNSLPRGNNKLLRIGLAKRLDLETLTESVLLANRHFEAICPPNDTLLQHKIPKLDCCVDCELVSDVIKQILPSGVDVLMVTLGQNGFPKVILVPEAESITLLREDYFGNILSNLLKDVLDHYHLPSSYVCLKVTLPVNYSGDIDQQWLEDTINTAKLSSIITLSPTEEVIRGIFIDILPCTLNDISAESDFFLIGGDSLSAGRFLSALRRRLGVSLPVDTFFNTSRVCDIGAAVDRLILSRNDSASETLPTEKLPSAAWLLPMILFYPMKAAFRWVILMYSLSMLFQYWTDTNIAARFLCLIAAIAMSRLATSIASPILGIALKWIIIGRYKEGLYPMWGPYHTRWWLVQKILVVFGKGFFHYFDTTRVVYYRMLGARIGKGVIINAGVVLGEYDLLDIGDNVRMDPSICRPFAVERNTTMYLGKITLGNNSSIGLKACVAPGSVIPEGRSIGPSSSSYEMEGDESDFSLLSPGLAPECHPILKVCVIFPIQVIVRFLASLPWMAGLFGIVKNQPPKSGDMLKSILLWWASVGRLSFHYLARQLDTLVRPFVWLSVIVLIKFLTDKFIGKTRPSHVKDISQLARFRTSLLTALMPPGSVDQVSSLFGKHYEISSVIARALGAKVGARVYWPGNGPHIQNYDLLEIGDDVVFGSRSHIVTSDGFGNNAVRIGDGSNVADRVVLWPGVTLGERSVFGSGAIAERNKEYAAGSVWIGNRNGKPVCLSGSDKAGAMGTSDAGREDTRKDSIAKENFPDGTYSSGSSEVAVKIRFDKKVLPVVGTSTSSPFGRAFYEGKTDYYVIGLLGIFLYTITFIAFTEIYWDTATISMIECLALIVQRYPQLSAPNRYRPLVFYVLSLAFESIFLFCLSFFAITIIIAAKWMLLGRRKPGNFDWDKSSYCQRWKILITVEKIQRRCFGGYGILRMLTGTHYIVLYFRALGAKIGKDCALFAGGKPNVLFTEPDLLELGDRVAIDDASLVSHINSRGNFQLNQLRVGSRCVLRSGSRLLSGAEMEDDSCLLEHTLIMAGEVAERETTYQGWPAQVYSHK